MSNPVQIIDKPLHIDAYGHSGVKTSQDPNFGAAGFRIMGDMWNKIKTNNIKHKGKNIWVYEPDDKVFAGVEVDDTPQQDTGMEQKNIHLSKYAYYKHIGPYQLIKQSGEYMTGELKNRGFEIISPYIEIYGHWTNDESKLETELIMTIK